MLIKKETCNQSALVPRKLPCPEKYLVARLHSGIILSAKGSILNVWQCSEYVCLSQCSVICTVTLCNVLHQTRSEFWNIRKSIYSGTCWHIKPPHSRLFTIFGIFRLIQSHSPPCVTLAIHNLPYSEPWDIYQRHTKNPAKLWPCIFNVV